MYGERISNVLGRLTFLLAFWIAQLLSGMWSIGFESWWMREHGSESTRARYQRGCLASSSIVADDVPSET